MSRVTADHIETEELLKQLQHDIFERHTRWLESHGDLPMVYFCLHSDLSLEPIVFPDAEENTKVAAAKAAKDYAIRLAFKRKPLRATFLAADTWLALVAPEEQEPFAVPAGDRLNRREAIIVSTFTPESVTITGRFYRREGRRIIWEEPIPDATLYPSFHLECRFDPWLSKRKAH